MTTATPAAPARSTGARTAMARALLVVALVGLGAGLAMLAAYNLSDRYVAADGTLVEPFHLVPLGALALAVGALAGAGAVIIAVVGRAGRRRTAPPPRPTA